MKYTNIFKRKNGMARGAGLVWGAALMFNMVATMPLMAYSIAEYAARVDPSGLGRGLKMAATVPAVVDSIAGSSQGGGGALGSVMPPIEVTIPAHWELQDVWVEGHWVVGDEYTWVEGHYEPQMVWVPEHTETRYPSEGNSSTKEPIDTTTGNNYFTESRISVPCPGISLAVDLKYQSVTSMPEGLLGKGWHHSYDWTLEEQTTNAVIHTATGGKLVFDLGTNGVYQPPKKGDWELESTTNGFEATFKGMTVYDFGTNGQLCAIHDAWGNRVECSYGTNDCLETVQHSNGRQISFSNEWNVVSNEWRVVGVLS